MVTLSPGERRPARYDAAIHRDLTLRCARSHLAWRRAVAAGWEPEDLAQEVLVRVIARQHLPSRYDPARSDLAVYLSVLTASVLANLGQAARRRSAALRRLEAAEAALAQLRREVLVVG